uniref:IZUMO family member 4 n=1 Tax=Cebus imitator TaxID=2715852 RepID=A0A2K5PQ59_CEBIM
MALLLCLVGMTAALAHGCLHCQSNFSEKFSFYRHHVNLKSWWVGDIPVSGALLTDWSDNTMKELHLTIPAEITWEKLDQVARAVYQRMDQLYQGKMYFPGKGRETEVGPARPRTPRPPPEPDLLPRLLRIFPQAAKHFPGAGATPPERHHRKPHRLSAPLWSSEQWKSAVQGLLNYINNWHK